MRPRTPLFLLAPLAVALAAPAAPPARADQPPAYSACFAPSVAMLHAPDDARDPAVPACGPGDGWATIADGEQAAAARCDHAGRTIDLARVLQGALPLDEATRQHVRHLFRIGQAHGRRADAFGLVGDSMTVSGNFLRPFAHGDGGGGRGRGRASVVLPAEVQRALTLSAPSPGGRPRTVLEFFRDAPDSFIAPRAAKVGARATWPLAPRVAKETSPLDAMVAAVSPAYAVVLYGANDAVWRTDSLPLLTRQFTAALTAIVDALEARGIVPILTTVPKHMREAGFPDCPRSAQGSANERFAAQATALSAAVADLACERHLPLVDLRWALDPLLDHGVGPDGVHLSVHPNGGGVLDESGLQCGYNVRNLVTLRELVLVVDAATAPEGPAGARPLSSLTRSSSVW